MTPHLLYIAFWFPPSRASGVYRALATVEAFVNAGWNVTVLTTTERFLEDEIGSVDLSLLSEIPSNVSVVRVPFTFDHSSLGIEVREMSWFRGNFPLLWHLWYRKTRRLREWLLTMSGRSPKSFPIADNYVTWIEPAVKQARDIHAANHLTHVLATGNPFSSFEIARIVGNLTNTPFSIDFRDPWTIDVFTEHDADLPPSTTTAERLIIEEAHACVHVNQAIADAYAVKYPEFADKQKVVLNGFDIASIGTPKPLEDNHPIRFGMLGTLNDRWPLEPIFEGWFDARPNLPPGSMLVLGGHLGYFARSETLLKSLLPDEDLGFEYVGPIAKSKVADFYSAVDVVVVPAPGGGMVTSGKVFEAAAMGVPVVCVQKSGGGAREVLEGHALAFCVEPTSAAVAAAFQAAATLAPTVTESQRTAVRQDMQKFSRSATISHVVGVIETGS